MFPVFLCEGGKTIRYEGNMGVDARKLNIIYAAQKVVVTQNVLTHAGEYCGVF